MHRLSESHNRITAAPLRLRFVLVFISTNVISVIAVSRGCRCAFSLFIFPILEIYLRKAFGELFILVPLAFTWNQGQTWIWILAAKGQNHYKRQRSL